jgi:hypothetical protein
MVPPTGRVAAAIAGERASASLRVLQGKNSDVFFVCQIQSCDYFETVVYFIWRYRLSILFYVAVAAKASPQRFLRCTMT